MPVGHMIKFIITYQTVSNRRWITIWTDSDINNGLMIQTQKHSFKTIIKLKWCDGCYNYKEKQFLKFIIKFLLISGWCEAFFPVNGKTAFGGFPNPMQMIKTSNYTSCLSNLIFYSCTTEAHFPKKQFYSAAYTQITNSGCVTFKKWCKLQINLGVLQGIKCNIYFD